MKRDTLQTNCQSMINRLSSIGTALKSICVTLTLGLIGAFYGSAFFKLSDNNNTLKLYDIDGKAMSYMWTIAIIFFIVSVIITILFAFLSSYYLSLERGYINMYYYAGIRAAYYKQYNASEFEKPLGGDDIPDLFIPFTHFKRKKYGGKLWKEYVDYAKTCYGAKEQMSVDEMNEIPSIKRTSIKSCLHSPSIYPFYIGTFTLSLTIIAFAATLQCFSN